MSALIKHSKWLKLDNLPIEIEYIESMLKENEDTFIVVGWGQKFNSGDRWRGIYKHNVHNHQSQRYIPYPSYEQFIRPSIAINTKLNKLYLSEHEATMAIVDTTTRNWTITKYDNTKSDHFNIYNMDPALITVNGTTHLIGGSRNNQHFIWNEQNNSWKSVHEFDDFVSMCGPSLLYVSSKEKIFLIGGYDFEEDVYVGIWYYCLRTKRWTRIQNNNFNFYLSSSVLSSDGQFIIISDGLEMNANAMRVDGIHVLDIRNDNEYSIHKSSIKCPKRTNHKLIRIGGKVRDEMIVSGWIKSVFKSSEYDDVQLPPYYIMQFIAMWYSQEEIHWVGHNHSNDEHYAIKLKYILSSL